MSFDSKFDRKTSIGASEAAAVLDVDAHRRSREVWLDKRGGLVQAYDSSPYADAGNLLESDVVKAFRDPSIEWAEVAETRRHPIFPFLSATPDRLSRAGLFGLEAKVVFSGKSWEDWKDGAIPLRYLIQVLHSLAVYSEAEVWFLVACRGSLNTTETKPEGAPTIDPTTLQVRRIWRRDTLKQIEFIEATEVLWWTRHVDGGEVVTAPKRPRGFRAAFQDVLMNVSDSTVQSLRSEALRSFWASGGGA